MKRPTRVASLCCAALLAAAMPGCGKPEGAPELGPETPSPKTLKIAVIPKGTTHEFWKSIHAGAIKAERELDHVSIIWKGPLKEDDREAQITVVEDFVSQQIDGIVLAPLDDRALVRPVKEALAQNIAVVVIDSGLQAEGFASFVATDNYKGGCLAGERMGQLLAGKGDVLVLRYQEGSASTVKREQGFLDTLADKCPGIKVVSSNQYAGATRATALKAAENLLTRFPKLDGIYCPNESSTFGMLVALRTAGRAGQVKFVGFDASPELVKGLRGGEIHGLVLQNPMKMGYLGVETCVAHIRGREVEPKIDTGAVLVTAGNMDQPEMKLLHTPDLSDYLGK